MQKQPPRTIGRKNIKSRSSLQREKSRRSEALISMEILNPEMTSKVIILTQSSRAIKNQGSIKVKTTIIPLLQISTGQSRRRRSSRILSIETTNKTRETRSSQLRTNSIIIRDTLIVSETNSDGLRRPEKRRREHRQSMRRRRGKRTIISILEILVIGREDRANMMLILDRISELMNQVKSQQCIIKTGPLKGVKVAVLILKLMMKGCGE